METKTNTRGKEGSTIDYNATNKLLQEKSQAYGQTQAKFATLEPSLRESMFGNDQTTNNLNNMESSKIDELFSHDQSVAAQYKQNPQLSQTESGRVLDPYARELDLMNRYRGTAGELTDIRHKQQTRRDVIGESLANALKLAQASLDMKKTELDQLQKDRDFAWEVYKEKNKDGGSQGVSSDLFNSILGLKQKVTAATPAQEQKTTSRKIGDTYTAGGKAGKETMSTIMSKVQAQYPGQKLNFTKNSNGTLSYTVQSANQGFMEPSEAGALDAAGAESGATDVTGSYDALVRKLSAAAISQGASTSDVGSMLQYMGIDPNKVTQKDKEKQATVELTDDLTKAQQSNPTQDPKALYLQIKQAYGNDISDSTVKSMMNAAGFVIY